MKEISIHVLLIGILLSLISFNVVSQEEKGLSPFYAMKKCSKLYYIDQTEVTVDTWLAYYYWMFKTYGLEKAKEVLPDSNQVNKCTWSYIKRTTLTENNWFYRPCALNTDQPIPKTPRKCEDLIEQNKFYNHSKIKKCPFGQEPITGLSYNQVIKFCVWRTKMVGNDSVVYRLPSIEEWRKISLTGIEDPSKKLDSVYENKNQNIIAFNYKLTQTREEYNYWGEEGQSVKFVAAFKPNKFDVYDLFGNVSEMTSTKGIALGGNFTLYANQCRNDSIQNYKKPEKWLGFRCIVKLEE